MAFSTSPTLLVTDLDNTLWDWFEAWYQSFAAMLEALEQLSGVPIATLEREIRPVHQKRGTTEYSYLLNELPSLWAAAYGADPMTAYDEALHVLNSKRKTATRLYPGVFDALAQLKKNGVLIVAYTESVAYWTEWRIKHTGLDGVIDILYSAPDHDLPRGVTVEQLRSLSPERYGLRRTEHRHVGRKEIKPNKTVLRTILKDCGMQPGEAVYVGDSMMKDVAMAQAADVLDVHARYGEPHQKPEYALLQRVSHWPDATVREEQFLAQSGSVTPTVSLETGFAEMLTLFDLNPAIR